MVLTPWAPQVPLERHAGVETRQLGLETKALQRLTAEGLLEKPHPQEPTATRVGVKLSVLSPTGASNGPRWSGGRGVSKACSVLMVASPHPLRGMLSRLPT